MSDMPRIVFVDDEPAVLDSLRRSLRTERHRWDMTFLNSPTAAWEHVEQHGADVLVSDMRMPGMTGLELLERMQQTPHTCQIPVVILTGEADRSLKRQALEGGAMDLLNKPVDAIDLQARIRSALRIKCYEDRLRVHNQQLEATVRRRTAQLANSRLDIVWRLAKAAEYRDNDTGNHVIRVACYSRTIAESLGLDRPAVERLFLTAPLHDIGKIGIPDRILLKPGKLDGHEWEIMKQHCQIGAKILQEDSKAMPIFQSWLGTDLHGHDDSLDDALLETACTIALRHHEKWDGSGYPDGLAGEQIPLEARIVAIADVFDALTSERPYKPAFSEEKTLTILRQGAGSHFDREVHAAFERSLQAIREIHAEFHDRSEMLEAVAH